MFYQGITKADVVNGNGVRVVLWVSGCSLHCKNCHNPETWDKEAGRPFDEQAKAELFEALDKSYIEGITFSGGHPLEAYNLREVISLMQEIKKRLPEKTIWLYTGFTWEMLMENIKANTDLSKLYEVVISLCDVIIDGPYKDDLRDITLAWRGSTNQRVIDVQKSLEEGKIIIWNASK